MEKKAKDELQAFSLEALRYKQVVVTHDGFTYRGLLIGADESELYLKGPLRYVVLPMDRITSVNVAEMRLTFNRRKSIDRQFYQDDNER